MEQSTKVVTRILRANTQKLAFLKFVLLAQTTSEGSAKVSSESWLLAQSMEDVGSDQKLESSCMQVYRI